MYPVPLSLVLISFLFYCSTAKSAGYEDYLTLSDDIATVESLRRDVRQPAPLGYATEVQDLLNDGDTSNKKRDAKKHTENASGKSDEGGYFKTYGSDAEGEKGYMKESFNKGDHGYKTFDTFHKRDGDKYGFEKHTAYGRAGGDKKSDQHHNSGSRFKSGGDYEGAGTMVDTRYVGDDGDRGGNEYSHYNVDNHDRLTEGADHAEGGPRSLSYRHSESYSEGNDDDGSYESSYDEGDHY